MDLCPKHNTDCFMNLVGSRTQISASYASAFLVPGWQLVTLCLYAGPVAWIMLFLIRQWTIRHGGLDNFSLWLPLYYALELLVGIIKSSHTITGVCLLFTV